LVEPIVRACEGLGVKIFYDKDSTVEFWGRNFIYGMRAIYGGARARYFVPFLSEEYLASAYPMDEFNTAMLHAIEIGIDSYILPVVVGSVEVPAELLSPAVGFLRLEDYSVEEFAEIIADRVGAARDRHQEPREVSAVVAEAFQVRLPRLPPVDFSAYEALEIALARVGELFQRAAGELPSFGVRCLVRVSDSAVDVRLEKQGRPVCGLRLRFEDTFRDDRLVMAFAWPRITGDDINGWATAEWDPGSRQARLRYVEQARGRDSFVTADELFHLLWAKIIDHLEPTDVAAATRIAGPRDRHSTDAESSPAIEPATISLGGTEHEPARSGRFGLRARWTAGILVVILLAGILWWWHERQPLAQDTDLIARAHDSQVIASDWLPAPFDRPTDEARLYGSYASTATTVELQGGSRPALAIVAILRWAQKPTTKPRYLAVAYSLPIPLDKQAHLDVATGVPRGTPPDRHVTFSVQCTGGTLTGVNTVREWTMSGRDSAAFAADIALATCAGATGLQLLIVDKDDLAGELTGIWGRALLHRHA
jgi:hypothetical protein